MNKLSLLICILMIGCASTPKVETVTQIERVVIMPPKELLMLPPANRSINVDRATQKDVAQWVIDTEQRMHHLEDQLKAIIKFYQETK